MKSTMIRNQARVTDLLKWPVDEYAVFIYNTGLEFMRSYFRGDKLAIQRMEVHAGFWNWWKNEWNFRDDSFIESMDGWEYKFSDKWFRNIYKDYHNVRVLAAELSIPPAVYPEGFTIIKKEMATA